MAFKLFSLLILLILGASLAVVGAASPGEKVLVVLPHPDDETIGLGGTIQRLKSHGYQVHCVLLTSGNAITPSLRRVHNYYGVNIPKTASPSHRKKLIREDSFRKVMGIYGCSYEVLGWDDGGSSPETVYAVMEKKYNEGYTHFYTTTGDGNIDHFNCHKAMKQMCQKHPDAKYRQFPIYWYRHSRSGSMALTKNYKDLSVTAYTKKKLRSFQVYYNINTILRTFYPYSSGTFGVSPERIYYIN